MTIHLIIQLYVGIVCTIGFFLAQSENKEKKKWGWLLIFLSQPAYFYVNWVHGLGGMLFVAFFKGWASFMKVDRDWLSGRVTKKFKKFFSRTKN
jgi:hypothetical protein